MSGVTVSHTRQRRAASSMLSVSALRLCELTGWAEAAASSMARRKSKRRPAAFRRRTSRNQGRGRARQVKPRGSHAPAATAGSRTIVLAAFDDGVEAGVEADVVAVDEHVQEGGQCALVEDRRSSAGWAATAPSSASRTLPPPTSTSRTPPASVRRIGGIFSVATVRLLVDACLIEASAGTRSLRCRAWNSASTRSPIARPIRKTGQMITEQRG